MQIFAASTCVLTLLLFVSFFVHSQSVLNDHSPTQKVQPTPPSETHAPSQETTEKVVKPTPTFSPQHAPLAKKDPDEIIDPRVGEDSDCDGINDITDNCALNYNPNQKDRNKDGKGDACDPKLVDESFVDIRCDMDGDGVSDNKDNCPWVCNPDQKFVDINENGVNDLCDNTIPDAIRVQKPCAKRIKVKAPKPPKPSPDKWIDPCEGDPGCDPFGEIDERYFRLDSDGDGTPDSKDNCPMTCNPDQKDANKNGIGDACDSAFGNSPYVSKPCRKPKKLRG